MFTAGDVLLELRGVYKSFGSKDILAGASMQIRRGEAVGIIGAAPRSRMHLYTSELWIHSSNFYPCYAHTCGRQFLGIDSWSFEALEEHTRVLSSNGSVLMMLHVRGRAVTAVMSANDGCSTGGLVTGNSTTLRRMAARC